MKKAILILLSLVALLSLQAMGQTPVNGKIAVGLGVEGGVPVGDFHNASDFGIGGMGWIAYPLDPSCTLTGKVGYESFSSKISGGNSFNIVPILVGLRYFLTPALEITSMRSYIAADAGVYSMTTSGYSSTKFGIAPALGAQFAAGTGMNVDLHVNYAIVFSDPSRSWVGFGVGLEFGI